MQNMCSPELKENMLCMCIAIYMFVQIEKFRKDQIYFSDDLREGK